MTKVIPKYVTTRLAALGKLRCLFCSYNTKPRSEATMTKVIPKYGTTPLAALGKFIFGFVLLLLAMGLVVVTTVAIQVALTRLFSWTAGR